MLDLLECNHWNEADKWLTEEYHQHNPMAASGRAGVIKFFSARKPTPLPAKMQTKIVAVVADGDLVTVVTPRNPRRSAGIRARILHHLVRYVAVQRRQGR